MKNTIESFLVWLIENRHVICLCIGVVLIGLLMGIPAVCACISKNVQEKAVEDTHTKVLWTENIQSAHYSHVEKIEIEGRQFYRFFNDKGYFQIVSIEDKK